MEVSWNLAKQSQSEISKPKVTIFISSTFVTKLTILVVTFPFCSYPILGAY
jgi:hypothetical protein